MDIVLPNLFEHKRNYCSRLEVNNELRTVITAIPITVLNEIVSLSLPFSVTLKDHSHFSLFFFC